MGFSTGNCRIFIPLTSRKVSAPFLSHDIVTLAADDPQLNSDM
jgi:hypothetical protein